MGSVESKPNSTTAADNTQKAAQSSQESAGSGIRGIRTTGVFRAVNFELYAKPNKGVMAFGLIAITGSVAYLAYMNATKENKVDEALYEQYQADGSSQWTRTKRSKWD